MLRSVYGIIMILMAGLSGVRALEYSIADLGPVNCLQSFAFSLNEAGQVVGYVLTREGPQYGFVYTDSQLTTLCEGKANGINIFGQVVGEEFGHGHSTAFLYSDGTKVTICGGRANAINDQGQVVGESNHAFLYSNGQLLDLGTLGGAYSGARDISRHGQVVGYSLTANEQGHAFSYENGRMKDLGTLGGTGSDAYGINDLVQVVGWSDTAEGYTHAFLFQNGKMTDLGTTGPFDSIARAYGINNLGQVVGQCGNHAFLYSDGRMIDLNSLLPDNAPMTLELAKAINDASQIVGIGKTSLGAYHAFLLTPQKSTRTVAYTLIPVAGPVESPGAVDGRGATARFSYPAGLALDQDGNLYVADSYNVIIRKMSPSGEVTTLAGVAGQAGNVDGWGGAARFAFPNGLAIDKMGNLYLTDSLNSVLRKINPTGQVTTLSGAAESPGRMIGHGRDARFASLFGVAVDFAGNVFVADEGHHTIRKRDSKGTVTTLAGLADNPGSDDGMGSAAQFNAPRGLAVDTTGNVYVADFGNSTIRKVSPNGEVTTVAGLATNPGHVDALGGAARFQYPQGLTLDVMGNLYVADTSNHTIRKIDSNGMVTTITGLAGSAGHADGKGAAARFAYPCGIASDTQGNLYVSDSENQTIRKIDPQGNVVTLAGLPASSGNIDALLGNDARFDRPSAMVLDSMGNAIVADTGNHTLRKIDRKGTVSTLTGSSGNSGSPDGTGTAALAIDDMDTLYTADWANHIIRRMTTKGVVTTLAGKAGEYGSVDGASGEARFFCPSGIAVDTIGNLFVADTWNQTIRKISPLGMVSTLAGLAHSVGNNDGLGETARFSYPVGVAVDSRGIVFVADAWNHTIRKIDTQGMVTTWAGRAGMAGNADGNGKAACFLYPSGLAIDKANNLYVADSGNHTLRKITPEREVVTLARCLNKVDPFRAGILPSDRPWYPDFLTRVSTKYFSFYPLGIAVGVDGGLLTVDNFSNTLLRSAPFAPDQPRIDLAVGPVGAERRFDIVSKTVTSWNWSIIRRPSGSTAELSSVTSCNPTFVPDVADLFVFRLTGTDDRGAACCRTVELKAVASTMIFPAPHPELRSGVFTVSFATILGRTYLLESKDSLVESNWTTVTTVMGNGTVNTATDPSPVGPQRYYRIRAESSVR